MSIIYGSILRDDITLCEFSKLNGNYREISKDILQKLEKKSAVSIEYS